MIKKRKILQVIIDIWWYVFWSYGFLWVWSIRPNPEDRINKLSRYYTCSLNLVFRFSIYLVLWSYLVIFLVLWFSIYLVLRIGSTVLVGFLFIWSSGFYLFGRPVSVKFTCVILTSLAKVACFANCSKLSSPKSWLAYLTTQHLFKLRRFWNLGNTNLSYWES